MVPMTSTRTRTTTTDFETVDAAARLGASVTRIARLLRQQADGELTPTMRAMLGTIHREGPIALGDVAAREQVAPPTVTKVVGRLEELGLVERRIDVVDRRVCRVAVTAAGRRWIDVDSRRRRAWLAARIDRLPADDRRRLLDAVDVLDRLAAPAGADVAGSGKGRAR